MPVEGALVEVGGWTSTADAQGRFEFQSLPPGQYTVIAFDRSRAASGNQHIFLATGQPHAPVDIYVPAPPVPLPGATLGRPYSYRIRVTDPNATFRQLPGGSATWMQVSCDGVLTGTPGPSDPAQSTIVVEASANGRAIRRLFSIPVESIGCPEFPAGELAWCERNPDAVTTPDVWFRFREQSPPLGEPLDKWPDKPWIVQFGRTEGLHGSFGRFDPQTNADILATDAGGVPHDLVNAVNASKTPISGSVLVKGAVKGCAAYQWKVVTETVDSSNILVYGPSEVPAYCNKETLLIVLPVHAIWATVTGFEANTYDPTWKPLGAAPAAHECSGSGAVWADGIPTQGIRPCDDLPSERGGVFYRWPVSSLYNRLTQPGASQGSISLAPRALKIKGAWDSQAYVSTRLGDGWIGLTTTIEHDHTAQDNLDSLTGGITYDWRLGDGQWRRGPAKPKCPDYTCPADPLVGVRPPEVSLRFGPEWAPGPAAAALFKPGPNDTLAVKSHTDDYGLNLVGAATIRVPFILNAPAWRVFNLQPQPSMISVIPVFGAEQGKRLRFRDDIATMEPHDISRIVTGVDASLRWPFQLTHNFLGDKPVTLEYSYRARWLRREEPYIDARTESEVLSAGLRNYSRVTLIMPFSAYLQIRAALQRGSLPPLFQAVGSFLTLGITFSNPGSSEH